MFGYAWLWLAEEFLQMRRWFFVLVVTARRFDKAICTITPKQHKCTVSFLKRKIQNVAARFAVKIFVTASIILFACMDIDTLLIGTIRFKTVDICNNILNWFLCLFKNINPLVTIQEKRNCLFFNGNIARLTRGHALTILIIASVKRVKSLFVHVKFLRTHYIRTVHVTKKFNNDFVIPTIRGECATHRNCSQLFHTCL